MTNEGDIKLWSTLTEPSVLRRRDCLTSAGLMIICVEAAGKGGVAGSGWIIDVETIPPPPHSLWERVRTPQRRLLAKLAPHSFQKCER